MLRSTGQLCFLWRNGYDPTVAYAPPLTHPCVSMFALCVPTPLPPSVDNHACIPTRYTGLPREMYISNAILEAKAGVPTVLHARPQHDVSCANGVNRTIPIPGRLGGPIEFSVATYLLVASEGISSGWMDADFCWWPEFDVEYGTPLDAFAVRTGPASWTRRFTKSNVVVDVSNGPVGTVTLL